MDGPLWRIKKGIPLLRGILLFFIVFNCFLDCAEYKCVKAFSACCGVGLDFRSIAFFRSYFDIVIILLHVFCNGFLMGF
nr:MAG TPA: hypothetical protein [Caudoviricetes sp.]